MEQAAGEVNEEKQTKTLTDEEAEAAFNESIDDEASTPAFDEKSETTKEEETTSKEDEAKTSEKKEETTTGDEEKPSYETLEKSLTDTKSWGHTLAEKNATLETKVAELEKAKPATDKETDEGKKATGDEEEVPDDLADYYKDYPEVQNAIIYETKKFVKETFGDIDPEKVNKSIEEVTDGLAQNDFERMVVTGFMKDGSWVDGHPDAHKVMASQEFGVWVEAETKIDPNLDLTKITDPKAAIDVVNRFKTGKAKKAAESHDKEINTEAGDVETIAAASTGTGTKRDDKGPKKDEEKSPEELFDEGAK